MEIRKGTSGPDSPIIVDSFSYGYKLNNYTVGSDSLYEICYILGGTANVLRNGELSGQKVGKKRFRGNFLDKKPSTAVFNAGVLTLTRGMNLMFFTAPRSGSYIVTLDCMMLRFAENCNIWYFAGNDEKGYRFLEIDGVKNRHDPVLNTRTTFPCHVNLEKGDSLVIGIGNYYGAVMQVFSLTAKTKEGDVFPFPSPCYSLYDHPHECETSNVEKTVDGIVCAPGQKVFLKEAEGFHFNVFSIKLSGRNAKKAIEKNFSNSNNCIFTYGYSHQLAELVPLLFLNSTPLSETMTRLVFEEIMSFGEQSKSVSRNSYVESAKATIKSSIKSPVKVADIAASLGISDRYLYNLFIKHEGISPKQFLSNARVEKAKRLLSESELTVTEVAEECGFTDVLSFSHFFSDHAGISPSAFKKTKRDGDGL